jgi:hypothetical protein
MFGKIKNMLSLDRWIENFEGYLDARIELAKYDIKEVLVEVLTKSLVVLVMAFLAISGLICLNFGLAYLISYFLGFPFAGFFVLGLFYALLTWAVYANRNNIKLKNKIEARLRDTLNQPKAGSNDNPKNDENT